MPPAGGDTPEVSGGGGDMAGREGAADLGASSGVVMGGGGVGADAGAEAGVEASSGGLGGGVGGVGPAHRRHPARAGACRGTGLWSRVSLAEGLGGASGGGPTVASPSTGGARTGAGVPSDIRGGGGAIPIGCMPGGG